MITQRIHSHASRASSKNNHGCVRRGLAPAAKIISAILRFRGELMAEAVALIIIAVLTAGDQLIKLAVESKLMPVGSIGVIENVLQLRYVENTGAAFSLFEGKTYILAAFTTIVIIAGIWYILSKRIKSKYLLICAVMVIAGGMGNLIDRVFRGYVIDYVEFLFVDFAVFNFADCIETVGASMIIGYLIFDMIRDSRKKSEGRSE